MNVRLQYFFTIVFLMLPHPSVSASNSYCFSYNSAGSLTKDSGECSYEINPDEKPIIRPNEGTGKVTWPDSNIQETFFYANEATPNWKLVLAKIGAEDRKKVSDENMLKLPHRAVALIIYRFGRKTSVCTGVMASADTVLTAAHCISGRAGTKVVAADKVVVALGAFTATGETDTRKFSPFGLCGVKKAIVLNEWQKLQEKTSTLAHEKSLIPNAQYDKRLGIHKKILEINGIEAPNYDMGVLKLAGENCEKIGTKSGWPGFSVKPLVQDEELTVSGYRGSTKANANNSVTQFIGGGKFFQVSEINGKKNTYRGFYDNDTSKGTSGAAVLFGGIEENDSNDKRASLYSIGVHANNCVSLECVCALERKEKIPNCKDKDSKLLREKYALNSFTAFTDDRIRLIKSWIGGEEK